MKRLSVALVIAVCLVLALASTTLAAHAVWKSGEGSVHPTYHFDLDAGTFNTGQDFFLEAVSSKERYLINDGAVQWVRMASKPTYAQCSAATLGDHQYRTSKNVGRWFCVRTSEDRHARFTIIGDHNGGDVDIRYLTWCKTTDTCG